MVQHLTMKKTTTKNKQPSYPFAAHRMTAHFGALPLQDLVTSSRTFPQPSRIDLQVALEELFEKQFKADLMGLHRRFSHETMTFADLVNADQYSPLVSPIQYEEIDIGEIAPARCIRNGLWLSSEKDLRFALMISSATNYGQQSGSHVEIAVPLGEAGAALSRRLFESLEKRVKQATAYRGKVISLEAAQHYGGGAGTVRVHKLRKVGREALILPKNTLQLLDRNVGDFIRKRDELKKLGMPLKKGLLFYGPPGTGKTHTIHYLASQLPDHTTLLVTSEQVALLDHYFQLARFLQPSMIVIEDVDLIARSRENMGGACEESLLNKLLNEMDGLREDSEMIFVLTSNRPEQLEAAIASRPGRIDQAVEFPLPDPDGRKLLVKLYSGGLEVPPDVADEIVRRTERASAAFIKELMRRAAQFSLHEGHGSRLTIEHVRSGLDEMLFSGGSLNVKLLGGPGQAVN
jgi:ATPase family associated with various cellular activities (AAA)